MKKHEDAPRLKSGRGISKDYQEIFDLKPIELVTGRGPCVDVPHTKKNYTRYIKSLLPRWNKEYAPMHWSHSSGYDSAGNKVIRIHRES